MNDDRIETIVTTAQSMRDLAPIVRTATGHVRAWLIMQLSQDHGLSEYDIARRLDMTGPAVSNAKRLYRRAEIDPNMPHILMDLAELYTQLVDDTYTADNGNGTTTNELSRPLREEKE